jgi:tRNA-splicing ligase RtcB
MQQHIANLPDRNLAYFQEGSPHYEDYIELSAHSYGGN